MGIILKLFFTILSFGILGFLVITSFIITQYPDTDNNSLLSTFEIDSESLTGGVMYESLDDLDDVFYSTGEINKTIEGNTTVIELSAGEYIFSLSSIGNDYNINYKGFSLKNIGPGIFYVNTVNEKKYGIFSISSLLSLKLLNTSDNSIATDVFLYPHGYMLFNPSRNYLVSGGDALRVSSVLSGIGYFNKNILDISGNINPEFMKNIGPLLNDKLFFSSTLGTIFENNKVFYSRLGQIRKEEKNYIGGSKLVEKYDWLFLNQSKKDSFYKSIIFNDLDTLFVSTKKETKLVNSIYNNLDKLKGQQDKDIQKVLNNYYRYISLESNFAAKQNFYSLYQKLSKNKVNFLGSLYYFRDIYNAFDFIGSDNLYSDMTVFIKQYFNDLGINIGKNKLVIKEDDYSKLDYFSLFLMKMLLEHDSFDKETITKVISIFDYYVLLDNNLYGGQNDKKIATGVKNHLDVLTNISKSIRGYYFERDRNEFNLLLKKKIEINSNNIEKLQKNINSLIDFFNDNKYIFNESDPKITNYKEIKKDMDEYFIAILDYEGYKSKYTSNSIINKGNGNEYLKKENAINLLSNFNKLSVSGIDVEIINDEYYMVRGLEFDYNPLSLKLYPYKNNLIDEIKISGSVLDWNYELGEKIDRNGVVTAKVGEDFFVNILTGYNSSEDNVTYYNSDDDPEYISTNDLVFKRDILLGDFGEFSNMNDVLELTMKNILIKDKKKGNIVLTGGLLKIYSNIEVNDRKVNYNTTFSSNYKLTNTDHYFDSIVLKVIDGDIKSNEKDYLLFGNKIKIIGRINNSDFKKEMNSFGDVLYDLLFIGDKIQKILGKDSMDAEYSLIRNKLTIKFYYLKKPVVVSLIKGKIDFIFYNGKNILDSKIELDKLEENLFKLK